MSMARKIIAEKKEKKPQKHLNLMNKNLSQAVANRCPRHSSCRKIFFYGARIDDSIYVSNTFIKMQPILYNQVIHNHNKNYNT